MPRPLKDLRMYYSDDHRRVAAFCAVRASRILRQRDRRTVDIEELMSEGWWGCLRRCRPDELNRAIGNTIGYMVEWASHFYRMPNATDKQIEE